MKKLLVIVAACASLLASIAVVKAARVIYNQTFVSETALAYNNTYTLDAGASPLMWSNIDSLSMQAAYSSATVAAVSFTDGSASTATVTVSSYSALTTAQGSNTLTVSSNTIRAIKGQKFTLNGRPFVEGELWSIKGSTTLTAVDITNAINNDTEVNSVFSATNTLAVITITCKSSGAVCNTYTLTSSTPAALTTGAAKFSGGRNHGVLVVAGQALTEGTDFSALASNAVTSKAVSDSIQANLVLASIIKSTWTAGGVITATSAVVGADIRYNMQSSSYAALTPFAPQFYGGTASNIVTASSKINVTAHGFTTGLPVLYTKSAGTSPGALVANTTYYVVRVDANNFKLASSQANALLGTVVSIATQTAQGGGTFILTPLAIAGTPSFKWQYSNDNSNWVDMSVSSVTMSSLALATTVWDFGTITYRYLRLNVVAPTAGGINLVVTGVGRSSN
jgi:hypothetical protein